MISTNIMRQAAFSFCMLSASCVHTPENTVDVFAACEDADDAVVLADSECAFVSAPLNYGEDNAAVISLFVRKFPAREPRKGTLILLAGGPGESGASFYADIEFFRDVFADLDLIVPDHRGTGYSTKLCEPEETELSDGSFSLVGDEWGSCFGQFYANTPRAHAFNLHNAARDVETLIGTLTPSGKVYLFGVSYGTSLAIVTAESTDAEIAGVILDSLTPLPDDKEFDLGHRSQLDASKN
jgi:pimeloyl-ACP methyl ester carboxylesterase